MCRLLRRKGIVFPRTRTRARPRPRARARPRPRPRPRERKLTSSAAVSFQCTTLPLVSPCLGSGAFARGTGSLSAMCWASVSCSEDEYEYVHVYEDVHEECVAGAALKRDRD